MDYIIQNTSDSAAHIAMCAAKKLRKFSKHLPVPFGINLNNVYQHLKQFSFWKCVFCKTHFLSTAKHYCVVISTGNCNILMPNGEKCKWQLSNNKKMCAQHHSLHTFCMSKCTHHTDSIWNDLPFKKQQLTSLKSKVSVFTLIRVEADTCLDNPVEKRDNFLRICTSLCKVLKPQSFVVCKCVNACLCVLKSISSECSLVENNILKKMQILSSAKFASKDEEVRILAFDSFSVSKCRRNSNFSDNKKVNHTSDNNAAFRNFKTAFKKVTSLDQYISIKHPSFKRKSCFVVSSDLYKIMKFNVPNHPIFSPEVTNCKIDSTSDSIKATVQSFKPPSPLPSPLYTKKCSKVSTLFTDTDTDSDSGKDFQPDIKKRGKKTKHFFPKFGKRNIYSSESDGDFDSLFMPSKKSKKDSKI